jgi:hypothetical protein
MIPAIPIITTAISWILATNDACPRNLPPDTGALTRLISDLNNSRSHIDFWFSFATALVVVGVAVEVAIVWIEFRKGRKEYRDDFILWGRGESGPPHKPITWHMVVELAAAAAVAAGVLGEFWLEREIGDINTCIQQADNARATLLEKEAGSAASSAEKAQGAADKAEAAAKGARDKADAVEKKAADLDRQLVAAETQLKTEQAQRAELERSLAPRTFSVVKNSELLNLDKLRQFTGTKIMLRFLPEAEAERAASNLLGVLTSPSVGWEIGGTIPDSTKYGRFFDGVLVTWRPATKEEIDSLPSPGGDLKHTMERLAKIRELIAISRRSMQVSEELVDFLKMNGWEARTMPSDENEEHLPIGAVGITVGFKPSSYFDPKQIKEMNNESEQWRKRSLDQDRKIRKEEEEFEKRERPQ